MDENSDIVTTNGYRTVLECAVVEISLVSIYCGQLTTA